MAATPEDKLSKQLSGISGECFVAAELSRKGFIAAVTLRNTRGADILVSRPGGKRKDTSMRVFRAGEDFRNGWGFISV